MRRLSGNTLTEYGIIGALVGLASVSGIMVMGNGLKDWLVALPQDMRGSIPAAAKPPATPAPGPSPADSSPAEQGTTTPVISGPLQPPRVTGSQACFANGTCMTIPTIQLTADGVASTSGGLGSQATHQLSTVFEQIGSELAAKGAEPALIDIVSRLALAGHAIGDHEKKIQTDMDNMVDGTPEEYAWLKTSEAGLLNLENNFSSIQQELNAYLAKNPNALAGFPEAGSVINTQADFITQLSSNLRNAYDVYPEGGMILTPELIVEGLPNISAQSVADAAGLTHTSSDTICTQGGQNCSQKKL